MAFTRKFLQALGIEADKIDEIITAHTEVTDALKAERDNYKADAEKLPGIQQELAEIKATIKDGKEDTYKVKYEAIKEEYEEFKKGINERETKSKKDAAFRSILKECGIPDKRIDAIVKVSDINSIEFDSDGNVSNKDELATSIKDEWADFIPVKSTEGAKMANPPANGGKATKTKEEIRSIADPIARQKAMMENPGLFGLPEND